ncbi:MAG: hypothetical protein Q9169_003252 [Polycauliona sp. 2 TL-2023]
MTALGSSVINKSGKKLAPKAPVRRPAPVAPLEPSTRNSVEPPPKSPTPQAQTVQDPASLPASAPPQVSIAHENIQAQDSDVFQESSDRVQEQSIHDTIQGDDHTPHNLHKRKLDAIPHDVHEQSQPSTTVTTDPSPEVPAQPSEAPRTNPPASQSPQPATTSGTGQLHIATSSALEAQSSGLRSAQTPSVNSSQDGTPATKRRKVTSIQNKASLRHRLVIDQDAEAPSSSTDPKASKPSSVVPNTAHAGKGPSSTAKAFRKPSTKHRATSLGRPASARVVSSSTSAPKRHAEVVQSGTKVRTSRQVTGKRSKAPIQDAAIDIVATAERTTNQTKGRRNRKEREPTPEEAEDEVIVPGQVKMADLCKDTRKGKKSDMLKALQERDKEGLLKKQQKELQQLVGDEAPAEDNEGNGAADSTAENADLNGPTRSEVERRQELSRQVPGTYVNDDGEIMIDTNSLQVDRHAQAAAEREQGQFEAVEENYLSRPAVNSRTYAKREKQNFWSEELTDEFYEALRMFGTDFDMIGRMLRKTRRAIKLKFTREEKLEPDRIDQTLLGQRIAVDVGDFSRRAGEELRETEEHDRMMEEDRKKIKEIAADELRAREEQDQIRKHQAEQERAAVPDDSSGKENREVGKKKEKRKKKKRDGKDAAQEEGMNEQGKQKGVESKAKEKGKIKQKKGRHKEQQTTEQVS